MKNSLISTKALGTGTGGNIYIQASKFNINDNTQFITSSLDGKGGDITVNTNDFKMTSGAILNTQSIGNGNGGSITINTNTFDVTDGGQIISSTSSSGNSGNITVNAKTNVLIVGSDNIYIDKFDLFGKNSVRNTVASSGLFTESQGTGEGGKLTINTPSLQVKDGASLSAATGGQGVGGTLEINTSGGSVTVDGVGSSLITDTRGAKNAGNLTVNTGSLQVLGGGKISASTSGQGDGGTLKINAQSGLVQLGGKSSSLTTSSSGAGSAGSLTVNTGKLQVFDGAQILASTEGQGRGGTLNVNAPNGVWVTGTGSNLSTDTRGASHAGNLTINTGSLRLLDGGQVSASTRGQGKGGTLEVNAHIGNVQVSGGELSAQSFNTGTAGNLNILTGQLQVKDNGLLTVSARNGTAGDININANSINLSNSAKITSQTGAGNGGNITINSSDILLMRRGSEISTTAGTQSLGGDGGNININTPFIIAVPTENSDITANAFSGKGGNVNIRAQSILGITPRLKASPLTSDITASSDLGVQGQINIIQPEVQPQQGIVELPEEVVDATRQVAAICPREPGAKPLGEFTVTGRGSLPPSPIESLPGTSTPTLATLDTSKTEISSSKQAPSTPPTQIIEAQGFMKTSDGNIELVAVAPNITPSQINARAVCPQSKYADFSLTI